MLKRIPLDVMNFYFNVSRLFPLHSIAIVLLGSLYRVLTISVFVAVLKIFLVVIDTNKLTKYVNILNATFANFESLDDKILVIIMLVCLLILILGLYISGRLGLRLVVIIRKKIAFQLSDLPFDLHSGKRRSLALDTITYGYEYLLKLGEILIFMVFMMFVIFSISFQIGLFIALIMPVFSVLIVLTGRKDTYMANQYRKSKEDLLNLSLAEYKTPIHISNQYFGNLKKNTLFIQMIGGVITIIIMILVLIVGEDIKITGFKVLFLIFSIRYIIAYASEFSAITGKLFAQRNLLSDVSHLSFDEFKSFLVKE